MSQLKYTKGTLYGRRAKPDDQADSVITAMQMAAKEMLRGRRGYFVAVRRGFPGEVIACGATKRDVKQRFQPGPWQHAARFFRTAKGGQ
jgi:hypothetical protein